MTYWPPKRTQTDHDRKMDLLAWRMLGRRKVSTAEIPSKIAILRASVPDSCEVEGEPGGAWNTDAGSDHLLPLEGKANG